MSRTVLTIHYELNDKCETDMKIMSVLSFWSPRERGRLLKSLVHNQLYESMFGDSSKELLLELLSAIKQQGVTLDSSEARSKSTNEAGRENSHKLKKIKTVPAKINSDTSVENVLSSDQDETVGMSALKELLIGGIENE